MPRSWSHPIVLTALAGSILLPVARGEEPPYPSAADMIPEAGDDLTREGDLALYIGDELFDYIDGGAPQYIEYGFSEVASQELLYNGHTYIFDVYRMHTPLAAFGIFSVRRPGASPALEGFPYSSFTTYQGMVAHGPYLMEIASYESSEATASEMAHLAKLAAGKLDPTRGGGDLTREAPFTRLPIEGRQPGTEELARGPISLRASLGADAQGGFFAVLEDIQLAMAKADMRAIGGASSSPWWLVAGYHPRADEQGALQAETILVTLVGEGDPTALWKAVGMMARAQEGVRELEDRPGWIWTEADGRRTCAVKRGADLVLACSRLEASAFADWAWKLAQP